MLSKSLVVSGLVIALVFSGVSLFSLFRKSDSSFGWVDLNKVYESFHLKKQLESEYSSIESAKRKILDSLSIRLQLVSPRNVYGKTSPALTDEVARLMELFNLKRQQFEEENALLRSKYNNQVLTQINQYVKDYAEEAGVPLIFGAEGSGVIMYADPGKELTDQLIIYINKKYSGQK